MHLGRAFFSASLLLFGVFSGAAGQAPASKPAEEQTKVAVVEFQPAVAATNEFQRGLADLQKKFEPKKTELKALSDEIDRLTKQLQADAPKLNGPEQAARAKIIESKKKQAQRLADDAQSDYEQAMQELFGRIAEKVGDLLTSYAKDHGYTLVMDRTEREQQGPLVLYASDSTDITKSIVDAYNVKSGVAGQAAQLTTAPQPGSSH